jgi:phage FluMu protein Com
MSNMWPTKSELLSAGLGSAMTEPKQAEECLRHHAKFLRRRYRFCPHCGQAIQFVAHCETCGRSFTSIAAFEFHKHPIKVTCPRCKSMRDVRIQDESMFRRLYGTKKKFIKYWCSGCDIYFNPYKKTKAEGHSHRVETGEYPAKRSRLP